MGRYGRTQRSEALVDWPDCHLEACLSQSTMLLFSLHFATSSGDLGVGIVLYLEHKLDCRVEVCGEDFGTWLPVDPSACRP